MARRNIKWKYEIGDNVIDEYRNLTIIDGYTTEYTYTKNGKSYITHEKHYKYKCNICGFNEGDITEGNLHNKKTGCSCCHNRTIVKGINDIGTVRPDLLVYFVDKNDAYIHSIASGDKVKCKCPICGFEKYIIISNLSRCGFACNKCSDGISYPEKFIMSMLTQLHVSYTQQYVIDDYKYKYDFYLPEHNAIIETHGEQHYTNTFMKTKIEDVKANDLNKKNVALQNGIGHYIELDCRKSRMEYIKKSVYENEFLNNILDLSSVDWQLCHNDSLKNILVDVCTYWKECAGNTDTGEVADKFNIARNTVIKYLHEGTDIGLCYYDGLLENKKAGAKRTGKNNPMYGKKLSEERKEQLLRYAIENGEKKAKKICQLSYDSMDLIEIHPSINSLKKKYGYSTYSISECCKGKRNSAYGYKWMYYAAYLEKLEASNNGVDLFDGLNGNDSANVVNTDNVICDNNGGLDLSWLDNI